MKDLGNARVMLGLGIKRDHMNRKPFTSQREYSPAILTRFGMEATPMDKQGNAICHNAHAIDVPDRQAIGSLMCLMIESRSDQAFAVERLHFVRREQTSDH